MNDDTFDQELQALFEAESLSVDANGPAANALLDEIVYSGTSTTTSSLNRSVGDPLLDSDVVELRQPQASQSQRWLLVAAMLALIAALGFGLREVLVKDDGPVTSDDVPSEVQQDGATGRPSGALVTIVTADLEARADEVSKCGSTNNFADGRHALWRAHGFPEMRSRDDVFVIDGGGFVAVCAGGINGGIFDSGPVPVPTAEKPINVVVSRTLLTEDDTPTTHIVGQLNDDVRDLQVVFPTSQSQSIRRSGQWFWLDVDIPASFVDAERSIEVLHSDGTVTTHTVEELTQSEVVFGCADSSECVQVKIEQISEQAIAEGADAQVAILADGAVSEDEYTVAQSAFEQCMLSLSSAQIVFPAMLVENSREAQAAEICYVAEITFVDQVRSWQVLREKSIEVAGQNSDSDDETSPSSGENEPDLSTPTSQWPAQEDLDPRTPGGVNRTGGRGVGLVSETGEVVEIDLVSGEAVRTITQLDSEAIYYGDLQLNWDGTAAYLYEIVEDSWFSCESSSGSIRRIDLGSGTSEIVASGSEATISPDGTRLAYLAASECVPNPFSSSEDFLTVQDTVAVLDIATGVEQRWTDEKLRALVLEEVAGTGVGGDLLEAQHTGLSWVGVNELALGSLRFDADSMTALEPGVSIRAEAGALHRVVGFDGSANAFILHGYLRNGTSPPVAELVNDGAPFLLGGARAAAFDSTYENLAVVEGTTLWIDGRSVELDVELASFDW